MSSAVSPPASRSSSLARRNRSESRSWVVLRRVVRARLAPLGIAICFFVVAAALFAPVIAPYDPAATDIMNSLQRPNLAHWLGTDDLGRDIFSRVIFGSRISLLVGGIAVGAALLIGTTIGVVAGYFAGIIDNIAMRIMDSILSFPALVLAIAVAAVLGAGLAAPMIAIAVVYIPAFARVARGQVLSTKEQEFVLAAQTVGSDHRRIMFRHVFPNITAPLIVQASLSVAFAILAEASLSFLGLGVKPPEASWGRMVSEGRQYLQDAPWLVFGPGVAIFLTVMGLNFVGDALRDALDPRLRM
ncbi:MAG: ABC transporter permease [Thermomicrobiales bacterium]|nr:ABC transporter permease [Thermomicrobiales bacterium]